MEFTLSIPTLIICLIIVVLFRVLDKKNRGLEKLKRFSDKTKEELGAFIKEKSLELNDLSINIDSQLKKSREILTRILSFEETLQGKADDFDKMKKTVDTYAASLDELINMSGRVDENLKRLAEESQSVEKMGVRLKESGARLAKLDAELKIAERRFVEQARGELKETEERLIRSHDEKIHVLLADVGRLETRAGELEAYLKRLELKKQEAVKLAEAAVGQALKSFEQEVGKKRAQESAGLKAEIDALLKGAEDKNQLMTENLVQVENRVKELDGEFTAKIDDFKDQFGQVERMFYTHLENAAKRGEDFEDEVFLNLKKSIDERGREGEREAERYFQTIHAALDKRKKEIVELFGALRSDTNIWHAELKKEMKQQEKEIELQLKSLEAYARTSIENFTLTSQKAEQNAEEKVGKSAAAMQAKMKELESGFAENRRSLSERTAAFEKDIRERLALLEKEVRSLVSSFDREVTEKMTAASREAEELYQRITAGTTGVEARVFDSIEKRLGEYEDEVQYRFGKLEKASIDVEALEQSLRETMASTADRLRTDFGTVAAELEAGRAVEHERAEKELTGLRETLEAAAEKIRAEYGSASQELAAERAAERERAEKELAGLRKAMEAAAGKIKSDFAALAEELEAVRAAERKRAEKELAGLRTEMAEAAEKIRSEYGSVPEELAAEQAAERERAEKELAGLRKAMEAAAGRIKSDFAALAEELAAVRAAERKRAEKELAGLRNEMAEAAEKIRSEYGSVPEELAAEQAAERERTEKELAGLRAVMEAAAGRIKSDFAALAKELEAARAAERKRAEKELAGLRNEMAEAAEEIRSEYGSVPRELEAERERAEKELAGLRAAMETAAARIRTELGAFTKSFAAERAAERERAEKELESLREGLTAAAARIRTEFGAFSQSLEADRAAERARAEKELESLREEIESIEAGVNDLKAKAYESVSAKLKLVEDEFFGDLRGRSDELSRKIAAWREELAREIAAAETASAGEIEKLAAVYQKRLERELAGMRKSVEADFKGLEGRVAQFEKACDERIGAREEMLSGLADSLAAGVEAERDKALALIAGMRKSVEAEFKGLENRVGQFERGCDERIAAKEEMLSGLADALSAEVEAARKKALAEMDDMAESLEKSRAKAFAAQQSFLESFDLKMKTVEASVAEIERHQKNFIAQTKIFERADSLKLGLEADLSQMKKDIAKIETYRKDLDGISKEFFTTKKLVDETNARMRDFLTEKKRIDSIESDFQRLIELSRGIDEKLEAAAGQHDLLQSLEIRFRELEALETDAETRYTRLEGRRNVVEATTKSVDKNFEQLTALEKSLKAFERELKALPKSVGDVKREIEYINGNREKTDKAVGRIEKLDELLSEIEARMEKLSVARDWLARTETRLEKVGKQAEDQLKLLETLVKDDVSRFKKDKGAPSLDKRQTVTKLARQGWSAEEIARATKLSRGEVELILELISDKVGQ